ncbi:ABC transporter substrate-binding protein [Kribbella solani]|uniref:Peptide/nickel transport system substrate-binding protein n=1 Tax=Kribbella solani TaxID=236067 RepID=A0A841E0I8_9ACTN|nr:ABC transporter substrate-binding protein [Kribbella solani]MBB5981927.1 peptide/nickel transport system substrate-binding protein [Kribbella solani]
MIPLTRRAALALAAGAAMALTACSGAATGGGSGSGGGEVVIAGTYPVDSIDPGGPQGGGTGPQMVEQQLFSRLVRTKADGSVEGDLATSWKSDPAAKTWTFTLRKGVKFSDGRELKAADVVDSFKRFTDLKGTNAANFPGYTMTSPADGTVVLTASKPDAAVPRKLTVFFVLPAGVGANDTAFFDKPVGTGPFKLDKFSPNEIVLVPNPQYYAGAPKVTKVTIKKMPELAARLTALRTGEADVVWGIPDDQLPEVQQDSTLNVEVIQSSAVYTMWFNSSTPALKDAAVRRALWQAVDFATIIKKLYPQTGSLSDSVVSKQTLGYVAQTPVTYDPDAAKAALTAAGFDFGTKLRLQFANDEFKQFNQAVVSDLQKIGVQVDLLQKEQAVFTKDLLALNWDINFQQLSNPMLDAVNTVGRLYPCAAKRNGYCNPALDKLISQAAGSTDEQERVKLYGEAEKIIWDDAVGMYPMAVKYAYAWNKRLSGFTPDPNGLPGFAHLQVNS